MRLISLFALLLVCCSPVVSAGSVTFTDPLDSYVYTVYDANGTYIGDFNTTETLLLESGLNYQIFVKPNTVSLITDPIEGARWTMAYIPVVFALMLVSLIVIGLVLIYRKGVRL
ncbi:hypothetical protein V7O67_13175 [Methanolobus sp. ZRKC4]|uniref:hypothetical protein n=1 Tax=Methanolobus sp. ZRKC4 TaxID=3125787 RepID=UPI003244C8C1